MSFGNGKKVKSAKVASRIRRKASIRKKVSGTSERPRLTVFRSAKHIYAQAVDDTNHQVLAACSDLDPDIKPLVQEKTKVETSRMVGVGLAKKLSAKNVMRIVFDRNGRIYHGRVRAVAEGAREGGVNF